MKRILLLPAFLLTAHTPAIAQKWAEMMQDPNANYYEVREEFENYWSTRDRDEKGKGYKVFRRWEHFVAPRVYPSGEISQLHLTQKNFREWQIQQAKKGKPMGGAAQIASATFTALGPFGAISGTAGNQLLKSGRLNFITVDPTNSNNLWVGAPAGGLWQSTNGGTSWSTNTDQLSVNGCSDLAIDPTNTNIMYLATGDGDGGDTRSIGVLKSTDGGQTWNPTGLVNNVTTYFLIRRLIINPSNPQILLAATNQGIYRTTNGGTSWTVVNAANCYDLEFRPGDPNIVYASGSSFRISTNGGASFTQVSSGIPTSASRMAIAVTPADSLYVYVLAGNGSNSGFLGFYRSTSGGTTFAVMSTTPNVLGWSSAGTDTGGQSWYDLCVAASPLDKDEVVVGGVNVWRSFNGGTNWSIYGHWTGTNAPFTHADHHDLEYDALGTLFNCNDGTVYKRSGNVWLEICGNINISQIYRLGMSSLTPNKWITGHQDNGTSIWNGTVYDAAIGGDGMDCFFDRTNDNNVFGESQNGNLRRSTNGGNSWSNAKSGLPSSGPWLTPWKQDPKDPDTLYCGYKQMYRSVNLAQSWTQLTSLPNTSADVNEFAIAPSNNQVIYVLKNTGIYKTTNGGTSWTTVTNGVPVASANPEYICIDPNDPNDAWVVLSGYSSGNKVYRTTNGGTSWTNISANLPNIPASCCVYQPGSNDRIYIGMDVGIYYRDNNDNGWTLYNAGLPNTPVSELEITPVNPNLLYAATYGRGVWAADLVSLAPAPPVSNFSIVAANHCTNKTITFSDLSSNLPTAWGWTISPATGYSLSSSSAQSPQVTFNSTGVYTVQFEASNSLGAGSIAIQTISISQSPTVSVVASTQNTFCAGTPVSFTASGATSYTWSHGGGSAASAQFVPQGLTVYSVTGMSNGCPEVVTATANAQTGPAITISGPAVACEGQQVTITASGSPNYSWSTGQQQAQLLLIPVTNTVLTVTGTAANGCNTNKSHALTVNAKPQFSIMSSDTIICPYASASLYGAGANSFTWEPGSIVGYTFTQQFLATTEFTLHGIDHKGCSNIAYFTIIVDECAALPEESFASQVKLYPNPGSGAFFIEAPVEVQVTVTDVSGKLLVSTIAGSGNETPAVLDLERFESGIYFVRFATEEGQGAVFRLIKQD